VLALPLATQGRPVVIVRERHTLAAVLATCVGITEADVRKWTQHPCYDIYLVQAWNHKRYRVTGLEAYKEQCRRG
jgi:hypothetical protein